MKKDILKDPSTLPRNELIKLMTTPGYGMLNGVLEYVGCDPVRIRALLDVAFSDEQPQSWRASWIVDHISQEDIILIEPYLDEIIKKIPKLKHDRQKLSFTRVLTRMNNGLDDTGQVLDMCIDYMFNQKKQSYTKAYAMDFLEHMAILEPGLKQEVIHVLQDSKSLLNKSYLEKKAVRILKKLEKK